jgi:hypothetical protein
LIYECAVRIVCASSFKNVAAHCVCRRTFRFRSPRITVLLLRWTAPSCFGRDRAALRRAKQTGPHIRITAPSAVRTLPQCRRSAHYQAAFSNQPAAWFHKMDRNRGRRPGFKAIEFIATAATAQGAPPASTSGVTRESLRFETMASQAERGGVMELHRGRPNPPHIARVYGGHSGRVFAD